MKNILLVPLLAFALLVAATVSLDLRPLKFAVAPTTFAEPPRVKFWVQLVLPKSEFGVISADELNEELLLIHQQTRKPLAQVAVTDRETTERDYRLTIHGHRWTALHPPPAIVQKGEYVTWIYMVRSDWVKLVRQRLAQAGWDWTRVFASEEPRINTALNELSREAVVRKANTTQLRRWILNFIDPQTNPDR